MSLPRSAPQIPDLAAVERAAQMAGAEIIRIRAGGITPEFKSDGSMVTPADRASEQIIRRELAAIAPNIPFVGEESVEAGVVPDISGGTFWCVDPLDGTRNFVEQSDDFAVLIGLVINGVPQMGVLYQPTKKWLCSGAVGLGVNSVFNGARQHISAMPEFSAPHIIIEHRLRKRDRVIDYAANIAARFPESQKISPQTAWPLCDLALGRGNVCIAFTQSYEWDTAAVHGLLSAVGGTIRTGNGNPLAYGKRDVKFLNPDCLGCKADIAGQFPVF